MPPESPRILELRRRVQSDPASIAFAQLAEEYRRAGSYDEAIKYCRTGLARHPGYLSARVTLGRALIETGALDEAARELEVVLRSAPDNLAAIRGMAEIHQRRGQLQQALDFYKRAMQLARHDPDLEETVANINRELGQVARPSTAPGLSFAQAKSELMSFASRVAATPAPPEPAAPASAPAEPLPPPAAPPSASTPLSDTPPAPVSPAAASSAPPAESRLDFDALLQQLGVPDAAPPPVMDALLSSPPAAPANPVLPEPTSQAAADDVFAALERELRAFDPPKATAAKTAVAPTPTAAEGREREDRDHVVLDELERWLQTLEAERARHEPPEF